MEINELQCDILRSAIHFDLSDASIAKCLDGDETAMQHLIQACTNVAAITGYSWMPYEIIRPAMNKKHGQDGGKNSGVAKRSWQDKALEYAQQVCDKATSTLTQTQLAKKIMEWWKSNGVTPWVEQERLVRVIREWEQGKHEGKILTGRVKGLDTRIG